MTKKKLLQFWMILLNCLFLNNTISFAQDDVIDNTYFTWVAPKEMTFKSSSKGTYQYSYKAMTIVYSELNMSNDAEEHLRGISNLSSSETLKKWYGETYLSKNVPLRYLITESMPDGHLFNNEHVAFDNCLSKTTFRNDNKIFYFIFSYPKADSAEYSPVIEKAKSAFQFKQKDFSEKTIGNSSVSLNLTAPALSFIYNGYSNITLQYPFGSPLTFVNKNGSFSDVVKEEKKYMKDGGVKSFTQVDTTIIGNKAVIMRSKAKNDNNGTCFFMTSYVYEYNGQAWYGRYTIWGEDCDVKEKQDPTIEAILKSVRFKK